MKQGASDGVQEGMVSMLSRIIFFGQRYPLQFCEFSGIFVSHACQRKGILITLNQILVINRSTYFSERARSKWEFYKNLKDLWELLTK